MKKRININDFIDFASLSNVQYAPNGEHIAFVVSRGNEINDGYDRDIYIARDKKVRQLTSYHQESIYLWEDNDHLLFVNMRDDQDQQAVEKGEERTSFYRINIHGGEAIKAFSIPLQVTSMKKLDATRFVCSVTYDLQYSGMYNINKEEKQQRLDKKKDMMDYEVFDEVPFYGNGSGYTNKQRNSLFLFDSKTCELTRITDELFSLSNYEISCDGSVIYYVGERYKACPINKEGIFSYHIKTGETKTLLHAETYAIHKALPWGRNLLVFASDQKTYGLNENAKFYLYDKVKQDLVLFANYEDAIGSSVGSDVRYGGGRSIKVYGDDVYFITTLFNRSALYRLDTTGAIQAVYDVEGSMDEFDIAQDQILFVGLYDMRLQELYQYDITHHQRHQITTFNEHYFMTREIRPCVPCNIQQGDMTLYGWVLEPRNYDANTSYPAILVIHGGPKTVYGEVYYHEMQVWANLGYFVFFMNPRGGDGRGNSFADIRGKYGTIDYDDIMKFCDQVCEMYPSIDANRIGVTGGSYGGFMTNWIIGHTDRFKAAVSQRSIANWISFANTSDIGNYFAKDQQGGDVYESPTVLWDHSPVKYAKDCVTPTLFIHSDEDYRCPLSQGLEMYSALVNNGVEARFCMFRGENHELSRSGKPKHRVKRLEEITAWMDAYLK